MKKIYKSAPVALVAISLCASFYLAGADVADANDHQAAPAKSSVHVKRVDINTATEEQLKALPGVNGEYARKIISGRPYYQKQELQRKDIVPADVYGKINKLIKALC